MKKVVCSRCGLTNLDRFVSFPFCAACGARLPESEPTRWRALARRPIKPLYWVALSAGAALMALWATSALVIEERLAEALSSDEGRLLVYARVPRHPAPDGFVHARFQLDSTRARPDPWFSQVTLRLPRDTLTKIALVKIEPRPSSIYDIGGGRYYQWGRLARDAELELTFSPLLVGEHRWRLSLVAQQHAPFEVRGVLLVEEQTALKRGFGVVRPSAPAPATPAPLFWPELPRRLDNVLDGSDRANPSRER